MHNGISRGVAAIVRPSPLTIVVFFFFLGNVGAAVCMARSVNVSPGFMLLYYLAVAWGLSWWVLSDCRARRLWTSIDHGWFVFYAWPVAVPYHLIKTRGFVRGCGTLLALIGGFIAAYLCALAAFFVIAK